MKWVELKKDIIQEYKRRDLKTDRRAKSLDKIEAFLIRYYAFSANNIERILNIDKQDIKKSYERHKGCAINGAESSVINEIYNQLNLCQSSKQGVGTAEIKTKFLTDIVQTPFNGEIRDEAYVINLCDEVLNLTASRQHRFPFLLGDPNKNGKQTMLPVDSYYKELNLVIEYREKQHTESVTHFDKPDIMTISGVNRGEQRKIYDERRRNILPKNGIAIIELSYSDFMYDKRKRIIRNKKSDLEVTKLKLKLFISK